MDVSPFVPIAASFLALFGRFVGRDSRARRSAEAHLSLYESLPEASAARPRLLQHIDELVLKIIADEAERRRDASGMAVATFMLLAGLGFAFVAMGTDSMWSWVWWTAAGIWILVGLFGLAESASKAVRDEKGRRVRATTVDCD